MKDYGFVRVASVVNKLYLADCESNSLEIIKMIKEAHHLGVSVVTFPELSLTGYTCGDLFFQDNLIFKSLYCLKEILEKTSDLDIISIIGIPISISNKLFNCAVVIQRGKILGIVPKTYIPNYNEFYEKRWFASSINLNNKCIEILGQNVLVGTDIIFEDKENPNMRFAVEICEDLWGVFPPSNNYSVNGAVIIFNLSSSNELIGKNEYRRDLVRLQSKRLISAYIYSSSGLMESTSDLVFGGSSFIYENGKLLCQAKEFETESNIICSDIDVSHLISERKRNTSFMDKVDDREYRYVKVDIVNNNKVFKRSYDMYPFVPDNIGEKKKRCEEILDIQANALMRRLIHLGNAKCVIGISGGLDSTLAFLVILRAFRKLKRDNKDIIAVTMPGFGTTDRTYKNAIDLVQVYKATLKQINIKDECLLHMDNISLDRNDRSIVYENVQARTRTQILMDVSNMVGGIVIGTGDLSELSLGWCTYNGDHMSMYAVNSSIPKTLISYLIEYEMENAKDLKIKKILSDILRTPISPELLPPDSKGKIVQKTESSIGPYVLHDFFLYYFLRYGDTPKKIYYLALYTFSGVYSKEEIKKWLLVFIERFFKMQFKRNCMPDGVKVGSISLSPRGDWRMPSDASYKMWINDLNNIK